MPLIDITNPAIIKFLVESYDKTARLRMKWNNLHGEKLKVAATLNREEKGYFEQDVLMSSMVAGMPTMIRDYKASASTRRLIPIRDGLHIPTTAHMRRGHSIVDVGLGDPKDDPRLARPESDLGIDPIMRPVSKEQSDIIYKGIPYYGRKVYLKSRGKIWSEHKYYFTQTSSQEYGWRLRHSFFGKQGQSKYSRVARLARDRKSRSGPQPDPHHYGNPDPAECKV